MSYLTNALSIETNRNVLKVSEVDFNLGGFVKYIYIDWCFSETEGIFTIQNRGQLEHLYKAYQFDGECIVPYACCYLGTSLEDEYAIDKYSIKVDDEDVGEATIFKNENGAVLHSISLIPECRNQRIGTCVIKELSEIYHGVTSYPDSERAARLFARIGQKIHDSLNGYIF